MTTVDVSPVSDISHKAVKHFCSGHYARAAAKYGEAVAAAYRLGEEASLAAAYLLMCQATSLLSHAESPGLDTLDIRAAQGTVFNTLLPAAMQILTRRHASASLLPGSCTATEEAWYSAHLIQGDTIGGNPHPSDAGRELLGYEAFMLAAKVALVPLRSQVAAPTSGAPLASLAEGWAFVTAAVELLGSRGPAVPMVGSEATLVSHLQVLLEGLRRHPHPQSASLLRAWQRLADSGVLAARGLPRALQLSAHVTEQMHAAAAASAAAHGLRGCSFPGCGAREAHSKQFKLCGSCKEVIYCGKAHQTEDWPAHKAACKAACKAAKKRAEAAAAV